MSERLSEEELAAAREAAQTILSSPAWQEAMRKARAEELRRWLAEERGVLTYDSETLLGVIVDLSQELDLAIGALRSLWDAIPKEVELPLKVAARVMFALEHGKEANDE